MCIRDSVATRVIDTSGDNIVESLRLLRPTLEKLADAGDSLPRGLMMLASFPFPEQSATLARGNYSNALFHLEFNLDKLVTGLLTGENTGLLPQVIQLCSNYSPECSRIQPLVKALCDLTGVDLACSAVTTSSLGARTDPAADQAGGPPPSLITTPGTAKSAEAARAEDADTAAPEILPGLGDTLSDLLNPLLGGGGR